MMKKQKIETWNLSAVEIYKLVLRGELKKFPKYFWEKPNSLEESAQITRYLIEDILKWNDEDIKKNLSNSPFVKNALDGMITIVFNKSPFKALDNAYPGKFKPWELKTTPRNYWNNMNASIATKWMIEDKLEWNDKDIKEKLNANVFKDNGLGSMLQLVYNDNSFKAIEILYPNKFKQWELKSSNVCANFWNKETVRQGCDWLFNERLHWSIFDIQNKITQDIFNENNLSGLITRHYKGSPYLLLKDAYPEEDWSILQNKYRHHYKK